MLTGVRVHILGRALVYTQMKRGSYAQTPLVSPYVGEELYINEQVYVYGSSEYCFSLPLRGVRSIAMSVFICPFVCPLTYLKNRSIKPHQIYSACCACPWFLPRLLVL